MITFYDSTHRMLPGISTTTRATVVTTTKGTVVVSPIGFEEAQIKDIRSRDPEKRDVVAVIEPNLHHTTYAAASRKWFPKAELWGVEGLPKKKPEAGWTKILGQDSWPFAPELEPYFIRGAKKMNEVVFYHPVTKTLITTDLVFNLKKRTSLLAPIMFRMIGIYKRFAVPSFWISMTDDDKALRESLNEILTLDFDRLIMAHGEVIEHGGKSMLETALRERKLI